MLGRGFATTTDRLRSEHGVSLILVGLALLALTSLSALVLDYGIMWVGRHDAQNAADAGALAGATSRAFEEPTAAGPLTTAAATIAADAVKVFGITTTPVVDATTPCPPWAGGGTECVQVNVFNDGSNGSQTLPAYFAKILGTNSQSVKAMALAQVRSANNTNCMKPWMVPDKSDATTYGMADVGTLLILRARPGAGQYQQADFNKSGATNCPGGGADCYGWSIGHCVQGPDHGGFSDGDPITDKTGRTNGKQAAIDVFNEDPTATWDSVNNRIANSCAGINPVNCYQLGSPGVSGCATQFGGDGCANGLNGTVSPRLLFVSVFAPSSLGTSGSWSADITNIVGFFLLEPGVGDPSNPNNAPCTINSGPDSENVCGYLMTIPGDLFAGATVPANGSTLNVVIELIK
jgi:Flp pilus assembly protein TadG